MIYLMRHGQDDESFIGGWSDVNLIDEGRKQVTEAALWIQENLAIKKIVCSDVKRAIETAKIVSEILGVPYELNSNLREQNKGLLNGMKKEEAMEKYFLYMDDSVTVDTIYPEGESLRDLYKRIYSYLEQLLKLEDNTLLITHRGVINMIYFIFNNISLNMDKKQFKVNTASIHELDKEHKLIKKVR